MTATVKICGLSTPEALEAALRAGSDMVGFVFFARSPRNLGFAEARVLGRLARGRARIVALTVDADDAFLSGVAEALDPDVFQLHGDESPARVRGIAARFGRTVMKAIGVAAPRDLARAAEYDEARGPPPDRRQGAEGAAHPGGNGLPFDWRLARDFAPRRPWLLSGGLTPANVADAIRATGARGVDVSSGVESAPGVKDP